MIHKEAFQPESVAMLGSILAEIEADREAEGKPLTRTERDEIAHSIMLLAASGESDRNAIKEYATGKVFGEGPFLDSM